MGYFAYQKKALSPAKQGQSEKGGCFCPIQVAPASPWAGWKKIKRVGGAFKNRCMAGVMRAAWTAISYGAVVCAQQSPGTSQASTAQASSPQSSAASPAAKDLQSLRPNALPYRIERKAFGANSCFKRVEFYWVPPKTVADAPSNQNSANTGLAKPRAFLVLATNMAKPRVPLENAAWVEFAQKQGLGIISVGFDELDQSSRLNESAADLANRIYTLADEQFGIGLKGATVASGQGAVWLHRIMMRQPWRWGFWATSDVGRYPLALRAMEYPAGVVFNTDPAQYENNLFFFQDLRRTKTTNRVGFLATNGKSIKGSLVDRMIQNYMLAVFDGGISQSRWYDVHSEADIAGVPKAPSPVVQSWVPGDEMPGAWKLMHQERKRTPDCAIATVDIPLPDLAKTIKVFFRVPGKTKEGASVRTVLVCLTWEPTDDALYNKLRSNTDFKSTLWERERVGVVGLNLNSLGFSEDLKEGERQRLEQVVKLVAAPFWKAIGDASTELNWPKSGLNLFGARSGATFAEALLLNDPTPSRFATIHLHVGTEFMEPNGSMRGTGWLVTTGGKHSGCHASEKFYQDVKKRGWPAMYKMSSGNYGNTDDWTHALGIQFISSLKSWNDSIYKDRSEGKTPAGANAAEILKLKMDNPVSYVDITTGRVLKVADREQVPLEKRMGFPTIEMEEAWRLTSAPVQPGVAAPAAGSSPAAVSPNGSTAPPSTPKP